MTNETEILISRKSKIKLIVIAEVQIMRILTFIFLITLCLFITGCGETLSGMVKDTTRIGEGVHKIFIKE